MENVHRSLAVSLGFFFLVGAASIGFLALKMGDVRLLDDGRYPLNAAFVSASGLRVGAHVEVAGVRVGQVTSIKLEDASALARVTLRISREVAVTDEAMASIRTAGIIGDKFVTIAPGASNVVLEPGDEIADTEPSVNLEALLAKYVFESEGR